MSAEKWNSVDTAKIPATVKAFCATVALLASPVLARDADEIPKDLHRSAPAFDANAPYCLPRHNTTDQPLVQAGLLVGIGDRVFHLCRRGDPVFRVLMNPRRVSGLEHASTSISVTLSRLGTYDERLARNLGTYDELIETRRLGGALYDVYQNRDPVIPQSVLNKLGKPPFIPFGNLYVYRPEAGQEELPPHLVHCNAEPKSIAENGSYQCYIHTDYHGLQADFAVYGGGTLFRPMRHDLFPALLEDMLRLLRAADVTDDPVRQACIRDGFAWQGDQCVEEAPR